MPKSSSRSVKRKAPWKKPAPKGSRHTHLSSSEKTKAKRAAKRAGRPYPNLVDNMRAAASKATSRKQKATRKTSSRRRKAR